MQSPFQINPLQIPEGFQARPAQFEDAQAVSDLFNAYSMVQYGQRDMTPERKLSEWKIPNFALPDQTMLVISPEGQIVAYADVDDTDSTPVHPYLWCCVHPDFEETGIHEALVQWGIERARKAIARVPEGVRVSMKTGVNATDEKARKVFESFGMIYIRNWWTMRIERPEQASPVPIITGISIRPMRYPEELDAVIIADVEAFRDHWGFTDRPVEEGRAEVETGMVTDPNFDITLWFVAIDASGEIAGTSLCRLDRRDDMVYGRIGHLSVRRAWRKAGLGSALLQYSFNTFWERGYAGATLGVDATNLTGATRLYEKAGMYKERHSVSYELELRPGRELATQDLEGDQA